MRDFTTDNYCDFLWINDLLELKVKSKSEFFGTVTKNNKTTSIRVNHVILFGTIVEIKQIGSKGFLYHVDDGTGVIVCKHSEEQFEKLIEMIETEQSNVLSQTLQLKSSSEHNTTDCSTDDSVFNDNSIQNDELDFDKKNQLMGIQSLWQDIYESFSNLFCQYSIGDVVLIHGKLYSYFNVNQVYVNYIRLMNVEEEIFRVSTKLEDGYDPLIEVYKSQLDLGAEKRHSGLMTFDHIHHLNVRIPVSRNKLESECKEETTSTHLEPPPNFDSFSNTNTNSE